MIQIQNDRFIKNWRKSDEEQGYPRYEPMIKPAFERDFREFQAFLVEEGLGETRVNQCEVTYVNHIVAGEGWDRWEEIEKIFTFLKQPPLCVTQGKQKTLDFAHAFQFTGLRMDWAAPVKKKKPSPKVPR